MAYIGSNVVYPSVEQICDVNRKMIDLAQGFFVPPRNLLNQRALEYILSAVVNPDLSPTDHLSLKEIAARIGYHIIARHVFNDGNKRTAAHSAWEFLQANGVGVYLDATVVDLTDSIAQGTGNANDFFLWLREHQES
jgi:death-on-curing family protein